MAKYICICGQTFRKQKNADLHLETIERLELASNVNVRSFHKIFKSHWQVRLLDFLCALPIPRFFRLAGGMMIYFVVIHHFKISWSMWEASLIGAGMGLLID